MADKEGGTQVVSTKLDGYLGCVKEEMFYVFMSSGVSGVSGVERNGVLDAYGRRRFALVLSSNAGQDWFSNMSYT